MSSRGALNIDTLSMVADLTGLTASGSVLIGTLSKDYVEVVDFILTTRVAGVGNQTATYTLQTTPTQVITPFTSVSAASANLQNNSVVGTSVQTSGIGDVSASLAQGRNLFVTVTYGAGVTSGASLYMQVTLRKT